MANRQLRKILMVTREYEGLAGAGGVKDASRQLAEALARKGKQIKVILPLYGFMNPEELGFKQRADGFDVAMNYVGVERREFINIWQAAINGVEIYLVDAVRFREKRSVYTYTAEDEAENSDNRQGSGHYDYFAMNVLLQKAALTLMIVKGEKPDIIHCQDGHTALIPAMVREIEGYRHYFNGTGSLLTIHNAGQGYHQEVTDLPFAETITGLPARVIIDNLLGGNFDPLLAAANYATVNTVSENYARELMETRDDELTGWLGHKLVDRKIQLHGITNGINPTDIDPAQPDKLGIAAAFSPHDRRLAGKAKCRAQLIKLLKSKRLGGINKTGSLDSHPSQPLFTFIGRFTTQKGVDKLIGALTALLSMDDKFQLVILGSGDADIENNLLKMARSPKHKGRICLLRGFDPALANKIYAAGDFFLIPSQYEPCGLTDFIAQLFANIPIVHHIGGLVKVIDGFNGFTYQEHSSAALMGAMQKAMLVLRRKPETITDMRQRAVEHINKYYRWDIVVDRYLELYHNAIGR